MAPQQTKTLRVVAMSDTHLRHNFEVPDGDILIHAGDGCGFGILPEIKSWVTWMASLPHRYKVAIAGNHDTAFEKQPKEARALMADAGITYLQDSAASVEGLTIYGSPWQPAFCNWAFNLGRGGPLRGKWRKIPTGVDILVTHGPPAGILDRTAYNENVGCVDLRNEVINRIMPRYHIFGHIHYSYGVARFNGTTFMNAAICGESYKPDNAPHVFNIEVK